MKNKVSKTALRLLVQSTESFRRFKTLLYEINVMSIQGKRIVPLTGKRYRDFLILSKIDELRENFLIRQPKYFFLALRLRYNLHCESYKGMLSATTSGRRSYDDALIFSSQSAQLEFFLRKVLN